MEIRQTSSAGIQIVEIVGRLDANTANQLESALQSVLDAGATALLLDCRQLTYVSSMGLRTFMIAGKLLQSRGGVLAFSSLNPENSQIFEITSLSKLFPCYQDRAAALVAITR